jgi:hypothetical protein
MWAGRRLRGFTQSFQTSAITVHLNRSRPCAFKFLLIHQSSSSSNLIWCYVTYWAETESLNYARHLWIMNRFCANSENQHQLVKTYHCLYGNRIHNNISKSYYWALSWASSIHWTASHFISVTFILVTSPHLLLAVPFLSSPDVFRLKWITHLWMKYL